MHTDDEYDYIREHEELFGHRPIPNLATGQRCCHPMHDSLRRLIDGDGVDLEIRFEYQPMISDDDDQIVTAHIDYPKNVQEWRDTFKEWEEEDAHEKKLF